jgi:hypothetical protein
VLSETTDSSKTITEMSKFSNSLQLRIQTVFIVSFLFILAAIFTVFSTIGKNLLEKQAYKEVQLSGQNIVSELGMRIALAESLATALANLGEGLVAVYGQNPSSMIRRSNVTAFFGAGTAKVSFATTMITITPRALATTRKSGTYRRNISGKAKHSGRSPIWTPTLTNPWSRSPCPCTKIMSSMVFQPLT